jgi:hypothetical protein
LLLAAVLAAWLLRSTVATSLARDALSARGLTCDERFEVEVSATFDSLTVGPTRCTLEDRYLESVELLGPAEVAVTGFEPTSVQAESVRVVLRDADVPGGSSWAPQLARLNLEQRVAGLVAGLSALSRLGLPATTIARGDVLRGTDAVAQADQLSLAPAADGRADVRLERIAFEAMLGAASLTLSGVTGAAAPTVVRLEGEARARASIPLLGSVTMGGHFELDASDLDRERPTLRLRADL